MQADDFGAAVLAALGPRGEYATWPGLETALGYGAATAWRAHQLGRLGGTSPGDFAVLALSYIGTRIIGANDTIPDLAALPLRDAYRAALEAVFATATA